ncbi:insecticidal delta-endotoxin Cry8Ea1 family protein [Paenibacillus taiwanensis]|uniref:insecticidal delta-endotoxin Cry8Ea1 family protein n=1 Tax=Paenibacillus taiwanensis TaxID=401638 RepID=UPI00040B9CB4|nr:insecticidal delta-endotoxin Cry8Ea1 family protein [Paenibacillus taiwanensis]
MDLDGNKTETESEIVNGSESSIDPSSVSYAGNNSYSSALNLNSCQNRGIAQWVNTLGGAIGQAVSIGTSIISLLAAPTLTGSISLAFNLIRRMGTGSNGSSISDLSICDLLSIINLRVSQAVLNDGIADFNGSVAVYDLYLHALRSWNNNPNAATAEELRTRFRIADSEFERILTRGSLTHGGSLARQDAQVLLLPSFVNAAYLHLLILRDASRYGASWGLFNTTPHINYPVRLQQLIGLYTHYCTHWYNQGLNEIRQRGNTAVNWLEFHRYRRDMTLMVLDVVSLFSALDTIRYPNATVVQLSRTVYTDPIGFVNRGSGNRLSWFDWRNQANFSTLESEMPTPSSPLSLNHMSIFTGPLTLPVSPNTHRARVWYGNQNMFTTGSQNSGQTTNSIQNISGLEIFRIDSQACNLNNNSYGVNRAEFFHGASQGSQRSVYQGYIRQSGLDNPVVMNLQSFLPGENSATPTAQDYTHILSNPVNIRGGLRQIVADRRSSVVVYGWTHKSLSRRSLVAPDQITQVPAVKASPSSHCTIIAGPGFTGGDLVSLQPNGQLVIPFQVSAPETNYHIRICYVSTSDCSLNTICNDETHLSTLPSTTSSLENLQCNHLHYFNVGTFKPTIDSKLTLVNTSSNANIIIDKIEFIPVDTAQQQN